MKVEMGHFGASSTIEHLVKLAAMELDLSEPDEDKFDWLESAND